MANIPPVFLTVRKYIRECILCQQRPLIRNPFCTASSEINRFNLLNHYETSQIAALWNRDMKWKVTIGVCYWANNCQTCTLVKEVFANDKGRSPPFLFMPGLGIKIDSDNIPLFRDVCGHLPFLLADRFPPFNFAGLVVFRNT